MNPNNNEKSKSTNYKENIETYNKNKFWEYYIAIKDYINSWIWETYDSIIKSWTSTDYFDDFLAFLKTNSTYNKKDFLEWIISSKEKLSHIVKREYIKKVTSYLNYHKSILAKFSQEYKLSTKNKNELEVSLLSEKLSNFKNLCYSQNSRYLFLLKNTSLKKEDLETVENDSDNLIKKIFPRRVELQNKILWDERLKLSVLRIIKNNEKVLEEDIDNLLHTFSISEKKAFITYFLPEISIKKAYDLWLINKSKLEDEVLSLFDFDPGISTKEENELLRDDELLSSIFIKTDSKKITDKNIDKVIDYTKNEFLVELDEARSSYMSDKIDINSLSFDKVLDLIKSDDSISPTIKNSLSLLKTWNYIFFESAWTKQIFKLNSLESWSDKNMISYTNVSSNNGFTSEKYWKSIVSTYSDFIDFLKLDNWDEKTRKANIKILTKDSLINEEKLTEIPDEDSIENTAELLNFIDDFDYKNKWLSLIDTWFYAKKEKWWQELYTIDAVWEDFIKLSTWEEFWPNKQAWYTFEAFAANFKDRECSRIKKIKDENNLIERLALEDKHKDTFKDVKFQDWKLLNSKIDEKKAKKWIEFLLWSWDMWSYRIIEIKNWRVKFEKWKFEEKDKSKKFTWKEKWNLSLSEFFEEIKWISLTPESNDIKVKEQEEEFHDFKRKNWFFKSWMWWTSIAEMTMWFKQIGQAFKDNLENWNKLKSAKFALAMWRFLPQDIREDLQSLVEWEDKKTMEQLMESLKRLDSKVMIPKVKRILESKWSQQYEIEAAMMSILKYGTLYPKDLNNMRWSYAWYIALWGTPWDETYLEVKAKCEATNKTNDGSIPKPIPFTEEVLVEALLSKQAKWDINPKRRSKIHKEYWDYLNKWLSAELEDGANKAWDRFTLDWRIKYSIWELKWGWYANWIWAIEKIWWKWWSAKDMHTIPFVLVSTGITQNFPESLLAKVVGMWWWKPYSELVFSKDKDSIELYKNATRVVIKSIDKDGSILKEFENIWNSVDSAYKFWNKYWGKLINRLNIQDPYIFSKVKVKDENMSDEDRNILIEYYWFITWIHKEKDFAAAKQEDLEHWLYDYKNNAITLISLKKHVQNYMSVVEIGAFRNPWAAEPILNAALDLLEDVNKSKEMTKEEKFAVFFEIQSSIEPFLIKSFWQYWWSEPVAKWGKKSAWSVSTELSKLKRYWVNIKDNPFESTEKDESSDAKESVYSYINSDRYKEHVRNNFENYLSINIWDEVDVTPDERVQKVKLSISEILEQDNQKELEAA